MRSTRTLINWFHEFNTQVFDGALPLPRFELRSDEDMPDAWGLYEPDTRTVALRNTLNREQSRATLLHEMVHHWQSCHGKRLSHGRLFKKWTKVCSALTGLAI